MADNKWCRNHIDHSGVPLPLFRIWILSKWNHLKSNLAYDNSQSIHVLEKEGSGIVWDITITTF